MFNWMFGQLRKAIGRSYVRGRAPNLNRLSRTRKMEKTSPSTLFSVRAILNRVYVQLDARPVEEGYREVVCSWKSSEFESTESCEKVPRPQPNSIFAQFSVVCMFNWMLGQLRKDCEKIIYSWKSSELESAEPYEKNGKNLALNPISVRVILSRMYVQLDVRPVEESYREIVYS